MVIENISHAMSKVANLDRGNGRPQFLTNFFKRSPEFNVNAEKINIDIIRSERGIAPVVTALGGASVKVASSVFSGVEVAPPIYSMERPVDLYELLQREPGETEWQDKKDNWIANVFTKLNNGKDQISNMIVRSVENQAAQVLQNGKITLTDENGVEAYVLDLGRDSALTVDISSSSTKWDITGSDPEKDINDLANYIAENAGVNATTLIFGSDAYAAFMSNEKIEKLIKRDTYNLGSLSNEIRGHGEIYKGYINLGDFRFDLYVYNGSYQKKDSLGKTTAVRYLDKKSVLVLPDSNDLDFRFYNGLYPMIPSKSRLSNLFPTESLMNGIRYFNKVLEDDRANAYSIQVAARPLLLPVSLDFWGVLKNVCA